MRRFVAAAVPEKPVDAGPGGGYVPAPLTDGGVAQR